MGRLSKVALALVGITVLGVLSGIVGTALGQGGGIFIRTDCTTLTSPITGASLCFQIAVPPKLWYWNGTAWAHVGYEDTTGTAVTLDTLNEIASVALAGQRSAVVRIPPSVTLNATMVPVASIDNAATFIEGAAAFIDATGASSTSLVFPIGTPTNPVQLGIVSLLPATHLGVKISAYSSGSAATTVRAMAVAPLQGLVGTDGAKPVMPSITTIGSVRSLEVALSHAVAAYGYSRSASGLLDGVNDEVAISGSGAGQITFEVPSGLTGTNAYEARVGTGSWFATPVLFHTGGPSTFPTRGQFLDTGFSEYRIRTTVASAGSTTATVVVSPGSGLGGGGIPCYVAAAASTNATNCKTTPGYLRQIRHTNTTSTPYYLRLYDAIAAPTCSSATGFVESVLIPASTTGAGLVESIAIGQRFALGIGFCITGGPANNDNTNAAVGVLVRLVIQ